MPSYISHAIMGEQLYQELDRTGNIISPVSIDEFKGYSLGADLSILSKKIHHDPQNYHTQSFFIQMIKYIKENKLQENSHIMSTLYGHIAHYFLDTNTHPLIYYIECGCEKTGPISNHNLVEGYLNSYLTEKVLGKNLMEIKSDYFNKINLTNKEIKKMLNQVYGEIYGDYYISKTYQKVISLFTLLEDAIKKGISNKQMLLYISKFNTFLEKNNLSREEITNESNLVYTNPVTGIIQKESFYELYNRSIEMALDAIKKVNLYLYSNIRIEELESVFKDLSYDTGVKCSLGNNMVYVRKRIKR